MEPAVTSPDARQPAGSSPPRTVRLAKPAAGAARSTDTAAGNEAAGHHTRVERASSDLRRAAAARLIGEPVSSPVADRFLRGAAAQSIDLSLMWVVLDSAGRVRQTVLAVQAPGRTAMIFLSKPGVAAECGDEATQLSERVMALDACVSALGALATPPALVQATPEAGEAWATRAYETAGWLRVGVLRYMRASTGALRPATARRRSGRGAATADGEDAWPPGISMRRVRSLDADREDLIRALDATYEQTLDCPAMCGMRNTADVLESHAGTGEFDPSVWWLIERDANPVGCVLLSRVPSLASLEIVYIGIGVAARGMGVGRLALRHALNEADLSAVGEIVCAVDECNVPAVRVYRSLGFSPTIRKVAYVRAINPPPDVPEPRGETGGTAPGLAGEVPS